MKKALVIIDVQKDYFKGGKWELHKADEALEAVKKLVQSFRNKKLPIIYVQHISPKGAAFFEEGSTGAEIHEGIAPEAADDIVIKHYPSSFLETNLQSILTEKSIDELYVCGMMSHMCVDTTVRMAMNFGYKVTLFEDACTTKDLTFQDEVLPAEVVHKVFMASLNGRFATVTNTSKIDELL